MTEQRPQANPFNISDYIPGIEQWAGVMDYLPAILNLIKSVEAIPGQTGEEKKAFVVGTVMVILKGVELVRGDQFDDEKFRVAIGEAVDAIVAIQKTMTKLSELNNVAQGAIKELSEAVGALRAARIEKAQPRIVTAGPRLVPGEFKL